MLVYVDESGDAGMKLDRGSTRFFVVTTAVMPTSEIAEQCAAAVKGVRSDLQMPKHKEFHFSKDNERTRVAFLEAIAPIEFWYSSFVLDKQIASGPGFKNKNSVYKYAVRLAFQNILNEIDQAKVFFDRCGGREFGVELRNYVRKHAKQHSPNEVKLRKIKSVDSKSNDLIQLADMVCGAIARTYSQKKDKRVYRNLLRKREKHVQMWPSYRLGERQ